MIPLPMLTNLPWKAIGWAAVVAAVALMGWRLHAWRQAYTVDLPAAQEALQDEIDCAPGSRCAERVAALQAAQEQVQEEILRDYEKQLADLRNRPAPSVPVRLCRPANPGGLRVPGAAPATGTSAGAELPLEAGRDIAVELYQLADDADAEALKLKALWSRDVALSQSPE